MKIIAIHSDTFFFRNISRFIFFLIFQLSFDKLFSQTGYQRKWPFFSFFFKNTDDFYFWDAKKCCFCFFEGGCYLCYFSLFSFDKKAVEREKCPIEIWSKKDLNVFFIFLYHKIWYTKILFHILLHLDISSVWNMQYWNM